MIFVLRDITLWKGLVELLFGEFWLNYTKPNRSLWQSTPFITSLICFNYSQLLQHFRSICWDMFFNALKYNQVKKLQNPNQKKNIQYSLRVYMHTYPLLWLWKIFDLNIKLCYLVNVLDYNIWNVLDI